MDKLAKIEKILGTELFNEILDKTEEQLKALIVQAETSIAQAKRELEENKAYVAACENKKDLSAGFRGVKKCQTAIIDLAILKLNAEDGTK